MPSARTSGELSGGLGAGASGAIAGLQVGGPWGALIGFGVGLVFGGAAGKRQDAMFANQQAWAEYGNELRYNAAIFNIRNQAILSTYNAYAAIQAAELSARQQEQMSYYNAGLIYATNQYNRKLLDQELDRIWQAEGLAIEQIVQFRARERGGLIAGQGASGTLIGEGSNKDVITSQMATEAFEKLIIRTGADRQVADIRNKKAQSSWQAEMAINTKIYEGQVGAYLARSNARIKASGILLGSFLKQAGDTYSATVARDLGLAQIGLNAEAYSVEQQNALVGRLLGAAGSYGQYKMATRTPSAAVTLPDPEPNNFTTGGEPYSYSLRAPSQSTSLATTSYGLPSTGTIDPGTPLTQGLN